MQRVLDEVLLAPPGSVADLRAADGISFTLMQPRNNLLVGFSVIGALFLAAIPMDWYTGLFSVSGKTGSLGFPGTPKLPIWFLLGVSTTAVVVLGLNAAKVTTVSRWLLIPVLLVCGAYYLLPMIVPEEGHFPDTGKPFFLTPESGPLIALGATIAAILLETVAMRLRPKKGL